MDIKTNFHKLMALAEKIGATNPNWTPPIKGASEVFEIDSELQRGKEIALEDLNVDNGILSVQGRQVLLYIADQGFRVTEVIAGLSQGRRIHVADCKTLVEMKEKNRFGRYHVTNNMSGIYSVFGVDKLTSESITGEAELTVCKNCLDFLNYENYRNSDRRTANEIYANFTLDAFFEKYSTLFKHLPKQTGKPTPGYTSDWADVSRAFRQSKDFKCEQCQVDLNNHKKLLQCHHISGNKQDNAPSNLKALCVNCHRQQPMHGHIYVSREHMQKINELRSAQNLSTAASWNDAYELADTAYQDLLKILQKKGSPPPDQIGQDITDDSGAVVTQADLLWTKTKRAVVIDRDQASILTKLGWKAITLGDALRLEM
jgi:hypothetical protein